MKIMDGMINLRNFFLYYRDKFSQQLGVEKLYEDIKRDAPHLLDENSEWVRIYRDQVETLSPVSKTGLELIKEFEGLHEVRSDEEFVHAYYDPLSGGLPITIGYKSTKTMSGGPFFIGDYITKEDASDLLEVQAEKDYWSVLEKSIPYWNEMNDNQRGALLSFSYNLGAHFYNTRGFDTISRVLREKDWDGVPDALFLYRSPGTSIEAELARRRTAEGELWKKPVYVPFHHPV
jgi:lysozyme